MTDNMHNTTTNTTLPTLNEDEEFQKILEFSKKTYEAEVTYRNIYENEIIPYENRIFNWDNLSIEERENALINEVIERSIKIDDIDSELLDNVFEDEPPIYLNLYDECSFENCNFDNYHLSYKEISLKILHLCENLIFMSKYVHYLDNRDDTTFVIREMKYYIQPIIDSLKHTQWNFDNIKFLVPEKYDLECVKENFITLQILTLGVHTSILLNRIEYDDFLFSEIKEICNLVECIMYSLSLY